MMRTTTYLSMLLAMAAVSALADEGDPPSRVARLNSIEGPVSFRPGSVEDWTAATLNYPLTIGDHLWADTDARAELHVGSTAIRMSSSTALSILNLDDRTVQLSLTQGSINVHLRSLEQDEVFEVDTPNVAISLVTPGDYRIDADGDQNRTVAIVRQGEADINGGGASFTIRRGESVTLTGMDTLSQEMGYAPRPDSFDQWCEGRDHREDVSVSARYVPREMIGYEDLDQYGVWREEPQYGWVWTPRAVDAGWAPYHYGHWAWVEPWGWTWIDDAPWGFAPFHYGRWAYAGGAWVWVPGRMVVGVRPVYAPALVVFVGGPRFGLSVAVGGGAGVAAWFPLGPGEVYRPAYHVSDGYVRNINIVHVTNINVTNVRYVNREVVGAVTVVPHEVFVGARPVGRGAIMVPRETIARAEVVGSTAPIAPTRMSIVAHAGIVVRTPPARFVDHAVVARQAPPPQPVSFAAKEQALRANGGRPLDAGQLRDVRGNAPERRPMVRTVQPNDGRRFGNPSGPQGGGPPAPRPQPEINRPMRNDRPPAAQPQPRTERPANVERPASNPQPQPRAERPANNPEAQPRTERPANVERPANNPQPQPRTERPANVERPANNPQPQPRAEQPKKEERKTERPARNDTKKEERRAERSQ